MGCLVHDFEIVPKYLSKHVVSKLMRVSSTTEGRINLFYPQVILVVLTASQLRLLVVSFASVWPDVHFKSIRSILSVRNVVLEQKIRHGLLEHVRGTLTAV